ncbi:MAG: adenylate/guanylate cyclase domain-containing protein [Phormidesmis sp.]
MTSPVVYPQIQRTLAAIVVTDAVGFSKRMSQDEDRALAVINRDLQLISELCEFFEGQVLKTIGDGVLMYFVSAVQAAACAIEMQKTFAGFAKTGQASDHFTHRVGVHLGDIFFNQQDMMGTGVNIAARLESEAKPGAICMSQVVYEVVKSRLELDVSYIGELSLKNIEEAVAAYHVWPVGMRPENSKEETTEAIAPLTLTPLYTALRALSEHPNSRRIKKLLYGAHYSAWENDAVVLEGISLKVLLESLTDRSTSLNECRHHLYQIVGTLNRQEAYTQVAEVVLKHLRTFYANPTQVVDVEKALSKTSEALAGEPSGPIETFQEDSGALSQPIATLCQDIADRLELTSEKIRLKKMLYCLCYDSWENDSDRIAQIHTSSLIKELRRQVATLQDLQSRLRIILLRLNRKAKYAPVADTLFQECQTLYAESDGPLSLPSAIDLEDAAADNTQINLRKKPTQRWVSQSAIPPVIPPSVLIRSTALNQKRIDRLAE